MKDIRSILVMSRQNSDLFQKDDPILGFDSDIQHELATGVFMQMGVRPGVSMMDYTERLIELSSMDDDPQTPTLDHMTLVTLDLAVTSSADVITELASTVDSSAGHCWQDRKDDTTYTSRLNLLDACRPDPLPSSQTFFDTGEGNVSQWRRSSGGSMPQGTIPHGNHTANGSHMCHDPATIEHIAQSRLVHGDSELNRSQSDQAMPETFDSFELSNPFSVDLDFHPPLGDLNQIQSSVSDLNQISPSVSDLIQMYPPVNDLIHIHTSVGDLNQTYPSISDLSQIHPSLNELSQIHPSVSDVNPIHSLVSLTRLLEDDDNMPKDVRGLGVSESSNPISKSTNARHGKGAKCNSCSLNRSKKETRDSTFCSSRVNIPTQMTQPRSNTLDSSSDSKSHVKNLRCLPEAKQDARQFCSTVTAMSSSFTSSGITTFTVASSHKNPPHIPQDTTVTVTPSQKIPSHIPQEATHATLCQTPESKSLPNWEPFLLSLTDMNIENEIEVVENKADDFLDLNTPTEIPRDALGHHSESLKPHHLYRRRFSGHSASRDSNKPFSKPVLSELSSDALLSPGDVDKTFLGCHVTKSQNVSQYACPEFSSSDLSSSVSSSLPEGDVQEMPVACGSLKNKLRSRLKAKGATLGSQTEIVSTDTSGSSSTQDCQSYIASASAAVHLFTAKRKLGEDSSDASRAKKTYMSPSLNVSDAGSSEEEEDLASLYMSSSETEERGKKRSGGRKNDDEEEDEMTVLAKRQKNRIAAQKCRHKKRDKIESLTKLVQRLESRQDRIKSEVDRLNDEREQLEEMLRVHGFVCPRGHQSNNSKH